MQQCSDWELNGLYHEGAFTHLTVAITFQFIVGVIDK